MPQPTTRTDPARQAFDNELLLARVALRCGRPQVALDCLERAHVLQQRSTLRHTQVHWLMLRAGMAAGDWTEVIGQVPRILAAALFSRLWVPRGNTGRARVPAMRPMEPPADLRALVG